eukprot:CCRYP_001430-RB/>CCRYP_001430-RB protein AED:0.37 eAED:0.34 QI:0/0/0/1/0.25/0/5/0/757
MDMEFDKMIDDMGEVVINTTAAREHVSDVEWCIRTMKERALSVTTLQEVHAKPDYYTFIKICHYVDHEVGEGDVQFGTENDTMEEPLEYGGEADNEESGSESESDPNEDLSVEKQLEHENEDKNRRYPRRVHCPKEAMVIDFDNKTYHERDGNIHVNLAVAEVLREDLRRLHTTKCDTELQDELAQSELDDHAVMYIVGMIMAQQYSLRKGLKLFGKEGKKAAMSELTQLHEMDAYYPVHAHELTRQQRIEALSSLIFLTQKRGGRVKGRTCVNGSKQRRWISKGSATSPMVTTESMMIMAAIEAFELRRMITLDIPGAFLHAELDEDVFDDFPDVIRKPASNRASDHLFQIRDPEEVELIGKYLPEEQAAHFHHTVAQLLLAGRDIQTAVSFLTTRVKKPDEDDWGKLKRVLKYLQGTMHMKLKLSVENMGMVKWWVDASYNAHEDCRGQTGAMMSLGKGAVVSKSTKQKLNLHSLSEGELVGIDDALPWILWARYFIETQGYTMEQNILFQDNKSTILLAKNGRWSSSKRTKHIKLRYFFIKDKVDSGEVDIRYVPTEQMWSDILTKPKQGKGFRVDRSHLMNVPEDYDEEEERKCMNPQLLPADNDDPVLPHGKLGQYCRSVLEDKRVEYKVSESTVRQNKERRQADLERVRIRKRRNLEDVRRPMVAGRVRGLSKRDGLGHGPINTTSHTTYFFPQCSIPASLFWRMRRYSGNGRIPGFYLEKYHPELMRMPPIAGKFLTGDGITLGTLLVLV